MLWRGSVSQPTKYNLEDMTIDPSGAPTYHNHHHREQHLLSRPMVHFTQLQKQVTKPIHIPFHNYGSCSLN